MRLVDEKGSSPRVRGRLSFRTLPRGLQGLIPACAGQTRIHRTLLSGCRAHPRVCGADDVRRRELTGWRGLIPACAGQTVSPWAMSGSLRAHPRVCGADDNAMTAVKGTAGSSPRVRGRHVGDR